MCKDLCGAWFSSHGETCELPAGHDSYHRLTDAVEIDGQAHVCVTEWTGDAREDRVKAITGVTDV